VANLVAGEKSEVENFGLVEEGVLFNQVYKK